MAYLGSIAFNYGLLKKYEGACAALGLKKPCTEKEIKKAYRDLSRKHHPDKGGDAELFKKIAEAKELLLNKDEDQYSFTITKMKSQVVGYEYRLEGDYYELKPVYGKYTTEESFTGTKFQYYVEQSKYATEILNSNEHQFVANNLSALLNTLGACPDKIMNKARANNNIKEIMSLIEKGVDADIADGNGNTLLMFAAKRGHTELIKFLLEKGVNVKAVNKEGKTAANFAREAEKPDVLVKLVKSGSDVEMADANDNTLLMFAAKRGYIDLVKELIDKGANTGAVNKQGKTAASFAHAAGKSNVLRELEKVSSNDKPKVNPDSKSDSSNEKKPDSKPDSAKDNSDPAKDNLLISEAKKGNLNKVKELIAKGASAKAINKEGKTAADFARGAEKLDVLVELVKAGSNVEMADGNKNTLLMFAAKRGHVDLVKALIDKGAKTESVNKQGKTAANFARESEKLDVLVKLVKGGSDVEMADGNGNTLLMFAAKRGHVDLMKTLLENGANVNAVNKLGKTAAHFSQGVDGHKHSELFLSYGIDVKNIKGAGVIEEFNKDPIKFILDHHSKTTEAIKVIDHYSQTGDYPSVEEGLSAVKLCLEEKSADIEYNNLTEMCGVSTDGGEG